MQVVLLGSLLTVERENQILQLKILSFFRLTSRDLEGAGSFAKKQMVMSMIQLNIKQQTISGSSLLITKLPSPQKNFVFYDETVDSRLKFTKIDYARLDGKEIMVLVSILANM